MNIHHLGICEKEKVHIPSETAESAVLSNEKLEELEEKKDLRGTISVAVLHLKLYILQPKSYAL